MVFNLESAVNNMVNSSLVIGAFNNPIYVALIITVTIMLTIYFTLRNEVKLKDSSTGSFLCVTFTVGIYVMITTLGIMTVQNKVINSQYDKKYGNHAVEEAAMGGLINESEINESEINESEINESEINKSEIIEPEINKSNVSMRDNSGDGSKKTN